jgi:perosamine synthetase
MIPYGRQFIDEEDIQAVIEVLQSDWLTTGPRISELEKAFGECVNAKEAVAVSSGTAALHSAMYALGIGPGDEVIVPAMTFSATANCAVYQGATPVFVDVDPETLLISPFQVQAKITSRTKAIIAVDYAGHPADYDALKSITKKHGIFLVADAAHALGADYKGYPVGALADLSTFSFHPVKHITTGEGGMITTNDPELAERMRMFRNHGIATDHHQREKQGSWFYEMVDLGYNYRITDFQCALGLSQLKKLNHFLSRRRGIAKKYNDAFSSISEITPVAVRPNVSHAYHLYVIQINPERLGTDRTALFQTFRQKGIGVNVHYIPVHLHPFYRKTFGTGPGLCPVAEEAYEKIISLPIFPAMNDSDVERVIQVIREVVATEEYRQREK